MNLIVSIFAGSDVDPNSQTAIDAAHSAAAQRAVTWTQPVHLDTTEQADGTRLIRYSVDAVPRSSIVTTDNVAPHLLPPRIV